MYLNRKYTFENCERNVHLVDSILSIPFSKGTSTFIDVNRNFSIVADVDIKVRGFFKYEIDKYVICDFNGDCYTYVNNGIKLQEMKYLLFNANYCIQRKNILDKLSDNYLYDFSTEKQLFELNFGTRPFYIHDNEFVIFDKGDENRRFKTLVCYNLITCTQLWLLELQYPDFLGYFGSEKTVINKTLGVYKDFLYVILSDGKLLKIDLKTGRIEKEYFEPFDDSTRPNNKFRVLKDGFLDVKFGKIYGGNPEFGIFDLSSEDLQIIELNKLYPKEVLQVNKVMNLNDNYLFINDYLNFRIGIVKKSNLEVVCTQQLEFNDFKARPLDMLIHENMLFIYDDSKRLSVFEICE